MPIQASLPEPMCLPAHAMHPLDHAAHPLPVVHPNQTQTLTLTLTLTLPWHQCQHHHHLRPSPPDPVFVPPSPPHCLPHPNRSSSASVSVSLYLPAATVSLLPASTCPQHPDRLLPHPHVCHACRGIQEPRLRPRPHPPHPRHHPHHHLQTHHWPTCHHHHHDPLDHRVSLWPALATPPVAPPCPIRMHHSHHSVPFLAPRPD